jgi:threonine/homoserine/homoserine lactone efflux protein
LDRETLLLFIPTIAAVSLTPGMCMTLAFSLGLSQGWRRTLWMMAGEMLGVALVITITLGSLSWLLVLDPIYLNVLAAVGACYLLWVAWGLWHAHSHFSRMRAGEGLSARALAVLGFTTAVMNPKGWAFLLALLPAFIDAEAAIAPQLATIIAVMLSTEFISLNLYAGGGKWLGELLGRDENLLLMNRVAAVLMVAVAVLVFLPE